MTNKDESSAIPHEELYSVVTFMDEVQFFEAETFYSKKRNFPVFSRDFASKSYSRGDLKNAHIISILKTMENFKSEIIHKISWKQVTFPEST